jgi:histidine phosphotransferase ChpT
MAVGISRAHIDAILAHAKESPDVEVCGLLLGRGRRIEAVQPTANVAAKPATAFEIDPAALIAAHRAARSGGPQVIGCYHSHPDGKPEPSRTDVAAAQERDIWCIVAGGAVGFWRRDFDGLVPVQARIDVWAGLKPQIPAAPGCADQTAAPKARHHSESDVMAMDAVNFASLLCSRLCHDLLSPVGALNNGIELLADEHDPEMRARCLELLAESARASANKLKFFRLAFGAAGGFGDVVDAREAKTAIEGLFVNGGRIELEWMVGDATLSKPAIKLLLNLALIAGDALVRGGKLDVGAETQGNVTEIVVRAQGERIVLDAELRKALLGETDEADLAPRAAAAWLAHRLATDGGGAIQASKPDAPALVFGATIRTDG